MTAFGLSSMGWAINTLMPWVGFFIGILPIWATQFYDLLLTFIIDACNWARTEISSQSVQNIGYVSSLILSISEFAYYYGPSLETSLDFFQTSIDAFYNWMGYVSDTTGPVYFLESCILTAKYYGILTIQGIYAIISPISPVLSLLNEWLTPVIAFGCKWSMCIFDWLSNLRR